MAVQHVSDHWMVLLGELVSELERVACVELCDDHAGCAVGVRVRRATEISATRRRVSARAAVYVRNRRGQRGFRVGSRRFACVVGCRLS